MNYKHLRQLSSCQPAYTAWVIWQAALGTCPPHSNRPAQAWRACLRFDSWTDHRIEADISTAINTDTVSSSGQPPTFVETPAARITQGGYAHFDLVASYRISPGCGCRRMRGLLWMQGLPEPWLLRRRVLVKAPWLPRVSEGDLTR